MLTRLRTVWHTRPVVSPTGSFNLVALGRVDRRFHIPRSAEGSRHGVVTAALQGLLLPGRDIVLLFMVVSMFVLMLMLMFMLVLVLMS